MDTLKILISNDDGVHAKGIRTLSDRLSSDGEHEVYVVAPDRERSATGHSLTLHKPLRVEEVETHSPKVKKAWSTTGTPSDCVKLAITELIKPVKPDIVISGVNNGPNLGSDLLYSGTVAAAMEGAVLGFPSIAVSLCFGDVRHFESAAEVIWRLLKIFPKSVFKPRSLLNVNVPNLPIEQIKGVRITEVGVRYYDDYFERRVDPRGRVYYWLAGEAISEGESENSDAQAVLQNYVSLSPVAFNMTEMDAYKKLQGMTELHQLLGAQSSVNNPSTKQ